MGVPARYPADAPVTHRRTALPSTEGGSVPGHQSTTSGANATSTPSCLHPVCGPLAVLDIGAFIAWRPSDGGPRRTVTTATLTHSVHLECAACGTFRIHRYVLTVSARYFIDASCVMRLVGLQREYVSVACSGCVAMLCDTHCTTGVTR
jgi:hypothetical protein